MRSVEAVPTQSVVTRVITLPLVSSAYDILSSVYSHAKDNHPYVKSVCEVAEMGMKTITSVALTGAKPIFGKLELQLALANDLACKGLDKIEETLPILHKPSDQVVATARDVMTVKVTGVSQTLTGVVDKTKEAVQDSVVITRAVVHSGVSSVMCSRIVELVSTGVDTALSRSEILVDQYLPLTDEELEREAKMVKGFEGISQKSSYYVRLGSLSLKLRTRAYRQAVAKVRGVKHSSQESISQLQHVMDLIESTKKNIDGANQKLHDKVHSWVEWQKAEQGRGDDNHNSDAEHIESRTLTIAHNLTHQLQITCVTLVSSLQGLPQNIQNQALSVAQSATDIYNHVGKASTFKDLSDSVLTRSKAQLSKMKDSLDGIMDYLVNNTPLNWLVGPFYPRINPTQSCTHQVEMTSLHSR